MQRYAYVEDFAFRYTDTEDGCKEVLCPAFFITQDGAEAGYGAYFDEGECRADVASLNAMEDVQ